MSLPHDVEQQIIQALHERASRAMTLTDTTRELERWNRSRKMRFPSPRILGGVAVAAVAGIVAVVVLVATGSSSRSSVTHHPHPTVRQVHRLLHRQVPQHLKVLSGPGLAEGVAFNAIWASNQVPGRFERVSLDGTRLLSSVTLPSRYVSPIDSGTPGYNPAYYGPQRAGGVMLLSVHGAKSHDGYLILNRSGRIAGFYPVARAGAIAPGPNGAWVQTSPTTMTRTDAAGRLTNVVVQVPGASVTKSVIAAAQAGSYLWVALDGPAPGSVVEINASTGAPIGTVRLPGAPFAVVATPTAAYVGGQDYRLYRVDAQTREMTASLLDDIPNGGFIAASLGTDGSVWILPGVGAVARLDPVTLQPLESWQLKQNVPGDFGAVITGERIFVSDAANKQLESFDR